VSGRKSEKPKGNRNSMSGLDDFVRRLWFFPQTLLSFKNHHILIWWQNGIIRWYSCRSHISI
jgi:hypothetical protein